MTGGPTFKTEGDHNSGANLHPNHLEITGQKSPSLQASSFEFLQIWKHTEFAPVLRYSMILMFCFSKKKLQC